MVRSLSLLRCLVVISLGLAASPVHAQQTWTGATNFDWNTAGNWSTAVPTITDLATFNGTAPGTINLSAAGNALGLSFTSGSSYTISGAPGLTLGASGIAASSVGTNTINTAITMNAAQSWTNGSTNALNISGNISNSTFLLTLGATNAGAINISGIIGAGSGGITVNSTGTGTTTLSGANSFTGTTTLTAGILRATNATALGAASGALQLNGGILQLANDTATSFGRNTTVGGNTSIFTDRLTLGAGVTQTLGTLSIGAFTLTNNVGAFVNATGTTGITFGAATLTGAAVINTNNSFLASGVTNTLTMASLGGNQNVTIGGTGNTTITGGITGTGALTLTKNGTGILTLGGGTNPGTGLITINAGNITVAAGGTLGTRPLTFSGTGSLTYNSAAAGTLTQALGALTFSAGEGTVTSVFTTGVTSTAVTFASLAARTAGATGNFVTTAGANGTTNSINLTGATLGFQNQGLFFAGADYAYVNAAGTFVRAPVYGTDAGFTTVAGGASLAAGTHVQTTAAVTAQTTATLSTLKINIAAANLTITTGNTLTLSSGGLLKIGGGLTTIGSTTTTAATLAVGTSELVIRTNATADVVTFNATNPVVITGSGGLTKTGAGVLNMANVANTFTGNININGGTLSVVGATDPTGLGAAGARTITLNGGTFQLLTTSWDIAATTKSFVVGPSGGTFNIGAGLTLTMNDASQFGGTGNLTVNANSTGVLLLGQSTIGYTYTGNMFVTSGTLRLLNASGAGAAGNSIILTNNTSALDVQATIVNNVVVGGTGISSGGAIISSATGGGISGTVTLNANTTITTANGITIGGVITDLGRGFGITKSGGGFLTFNAANTFSGGVTLASTNTGQLALGNNSALGTGALTVAAGQPATANIVASGNLVMANSVILNGDISFGLLGNTNVGTMTFGSLDLGAGAPRTITVPLTSVVPMTFTGPITNGALTVAGPGTLALRGTGSFTGAVTVNQGGTLSVGSTALAATTSVSIGSSITSSLNFLADGVGAPVNLASGTTVSLGGAGSSALLGFQLGSPSAADSLNLSGATGNLSVGAGGAVIGITPAAGFFPVAGTNTYNLITTSGGGTITGFSNITLPLAQLPTGYTYTYSTSATAVTLSVTGGAAGNLFWNGTGNTSWNATPTTVWSDSTGATPSLFAPNATNTVVFSSGTITGTTAVTTTLDQNFSALGLSVNNNSTGAVTINQGTFGVLTLGTSGINIATGGPASTTINAPITLAGAQTWTVTDATQTLTIQGANRQGIVSGAFAVTLAGAGTVTLGGFNTFSGLTTGSGQLNINNGGSTTTNSALGSGTVNFAGATTTLDNTSGVAQSVLTAGAQTWGGNIVFTGTSSLNLGTGGITLGANRTVTVNGGTLQLGGVIAAQAFGITKNGTGALTLSGASLNTGQFVLNAGTVNINAAAALGAATATVAINGGSIDNKAGAAVVGTTAGAMTLGADVNFLGSGALTLPGAVALSADRAINTTSPGLGINNSALTLSGIYSGAFNLTKNGSGSLILSGANTFGGAANTLTLNAGTLAANSATNNVFGAAGTTLVINGGALDAITASAPAANYAQTWGGDFAFLGTNTLNLGTGAVSLSADRTVTVIASTLTVGGVISGSSALTLNGGGTLALTGANSYTGATTINAGATLNLGNGTATGSLASTVLNLNGGTFTNTVTAANVQTFTTTNLNSGASQVTANVAAATVNLGSIVRASGGTLNLTATGPIITSNPNDATGILGGWATLAGTNWAVTNGASTVTAYSAYTPSIAGTTTPGAGTNVDFQASNTAAWATQSINSLRFGTAIASTLSITAANTLTLDAGGILINPTVATNNSVITGGTISTTGDLVVSNFATTGTLNINSIIAAAGLTKSGTSTGAVIIGGTTGTVTNALTGTITVNAGVLQVNSSSATGGNGATGALNSLPIVLNGGTLSLKFDDTVGNSLPASIATASSLTVNGNATILVDRLAAGNPIGSATFLTPLNKTIQLTTLNFGNAGRTLTVTPSNGYGLEFTGTTTLNQNLTTINVGTVTASNVVQGLTLSGQVTGTIPGGSWTKAGVGTIVLNNALNDFTSNIVLSAGTLAVNSDAALGNAANTITFTGTTAATTLRAFGGTSASPLSIATSRTINLWGSAAANNVIEVAANTTLTLNSVFGGGNSPLSKADLGTLVLNADNGPWAGQLSISAGVVRITNNGALGISTATATGNTVVSAAGAALQLAGVNIFEQLNLTGSGISSGGALQAVSGTNTVNALITLGGASNIGADSGAVLNIRGGFNGAQTVTFAGAGTINVDTTAIPAITSIVKIGTGTTTIGSSNPAFVGAITVNAGTLVLGGALGAGAGTVGGTGAIAVAPSGTLTVDDSVGLAIANRLTNGAAAIRSITLTAGNFNYIGNPGLNSFESLGALTMARGETTVTVTSGAGAGARLTFGAPTRSVGGTALFRGSNLGSAPGAGVASIASTLTGFTFTGAGAAGTVTKGILPWALVDSSVSGTGTSFATADTVTGNLRALAPSEYLTSLVSINSNANVANIVLGAADRVAGTSTINSLTLTSTGTLTLNPLQTLTVGGGTNMGGFFNSAATTITGGFLTNGAIVAGGEMIFHANANLTLDTVMIGTQAGSQPMLTKTGAGNLTLTKANAYVGQTVVNQGTLTLAGGNNTIFFNSAGTSYLAVNAGGTLDLNGNSQQVAGLFTDAAYSTPTAVVTGAAGSTLVTNSDARNWGGVISGSVAFQRGGSATATIFYSDNTYTGPTLISGGTITLQDAGRISNSASIGIDYNAELRIDNAAGTLNLSDRVNDAAAISMRGGILTFNGRASTNSAETVGAITLAQGTSRISMGAVTGTVASAELTTTNLIRTTGQGNITFNLQGTTTYGLIGSGPRIYLQQINGVSTNTLGSGLTNNIIGPWAVAQGGIASDWATYNPVLGVGFLGQAGYAGYSNIGTTATAATLAAAGPNDNVNLDVAIASNSVLASNKTVNTLRLGNVAINPIDINSGVTLTLGNGTSGGLLQFSNTAASIGLTPNTGTLTSGGPELFFFTQGSAVLTVNSVISGIGMKLIKSGPLSTSGGLTLAGTNTYTGGTEVNVTSLTVAATGTLGTGGIVLNSGTLTQVALGVIPSQTVTLNGSSTLTLASVGNSLGNLTFNVDGGAQTGPALAIGANSLALTGSITAGGSNPNAQAIISGAGGLNLVGNASFNVVVNAFAWNGQSVAPLSAPLSITANIANGGIVKTGGGLLSLAGANTYAGTTDVQTGGLILAASTILTTGPVGTGTLLLSGNSTTLTADATARSISNAITLGNSATNLTLGVYGANALALTGNVVWSTGTGVSRTLNVNAVTNGGTTVNTQTLGGVITSAGTGNQIIKQGIGILAITGNNAATLDWTGSQAVQILNGSFLIGADSALGAVPGSAVVDNIVLNGGELATSTGFTLAANRGISLGTSNGVVDTSTFFNTIAGTVSGSGGLVKNGSGTLTISGASTFTGSLFVTAGTVAFTNAAAPTLSNITVAGGAGLSLINGSAQAINLGSGALNLGAGTGTTSLSLELLGTGANDSITTTGVSNASGTVILNLTRLPGATAGTFTLLTAAGGLNNATYALNPAGWQVSAFTTSATSIQVTATPVSGDLFWAGAVNLSWGGLDGSFNSNFSTNLTGTNAKSTPGTDQGVTFSANGLTVTTLNTTLDINSSIRDLTFSNNVGTGPLGTINIAPGNGGTLSITPAVSTAGINVQAGAPAAINISAPVILGANQTWTVADAATVLNVSGNITGTANLTTTGSGIVQLGGTNSYNGTTTINSGVLRPGAANGLNANSAFVVGATGTLRLNGVAAAIGSLSGPAGATVENFNATAGTLTAGSDNTSTVFAGTIQNGIGAGSLALTKVGTGVFTLTGSYSFTGATSVNGGTMVFAGTSAGSTAVTANNPGSVIQIGSAIGLTSSNAVSITAGTALDLNGFSVTTGALTSVATSLITNTGTGVGASTATAPGTPTLTDALIVSPATAAVLANLITDGATRKTQIVLNNANANTQMTGNTANTFSGGLVLANNGSGTRLSVGTIVGTPFGTGPIIIGQVATDKAGIFFGTAGQTLANPIIFNTALGTDRVGLRADGGIATLTGVITANLAPATFTSNTATGAGVLINNQVTGAFGLVLDIVSLSSATTSFNVTLNNTTLNANDYAGDTVVNFNAATTKSATLNLGAANQIPNGLGKGNVVLNTTGTGVGLLNMAGFSDTINGLSGTGTVDGTSGTPTLTLGDGNATASFAGILQNTAGTLTLTKIGSGTQTLSGASTFAGPVNVTGGLIAFATAPATSGPLGNSTVVNISGGGISYTGAASNALNRTLAIGATNGVVDVSTLTGTLTMVGANVTSSGGNLVKTGLGTASISGTTSLNAGAAGVVVNGGTLQAGFGSNGISTINVGASGNLKFVNSTIESLTLGNTAGALTLGGGARIGLEVNGGTNDSIALGATGTAVAAGTITLDFFNFGAGVTSGNTYTLLSSTAGGLTSGGATYVIGTAPLGFNYSITQTDNLVTVGVVTFSPQYWRGNVDGSWSTAGNWFTDAAGTIPGALPGSGDTVIFSTTNAVATGGIISTTLDANLTIFSLQGISAPTTPVTTSVTIAAGTGTSLTIQPTSTNSGIDIGANAGAFTISAALVASNVGAATQTWNVDGSGVSSLTLSGTVTYNANVIKTGAGVLTLSGTGNSGTSNFSLNAGSVLFNSATSLPTGVLALGLGGGSAVTLNNTNAGSLTLTNTSYAWNADIALPGSALDLGAGSVLMGGNVTITNANSLTVGGVISETGGSRTLTKAGAGAMILNGNNSYTGLTTLTLGTLTLAGNNSTATGGVTVSAGQLNINNDNALGSGRLTLNTSTIDSTNGARVVAGNNVQTWANAATVTFAGTNTLNLGTGTVTLGADATAATITLTNNSALTGTTLTVGGNFTSGTGGTAGAKTLVINGTNPGTTLLSGTLDKGTATGLIVTNSLPATATLRLSGVSTIQTLNITTTGGIVDLTGGNLSISNAGAAAINSTNNATINGGTLTLLTGIAGTATAVQNYMDVGATAGTLTINSVIAGAPGIGVDFWPATSTIVLTGANTFTGPVSINGTVRVTTIGDVGVAGNLGLGTILGTNPTPISFSNSTNAGTLVYLGTGETTNRAINLAGTTATSTIDMSGTGTLRFTNTSPIISSGAGAKALALQGSTAGIGQFDGIIQNATNGGAAISVSKLGTGKWILTGTNTYTGTTNIDNGILQFTALTQTLGALTFGAAAAGTNVGTLDLSTANVTFAGVATVQTNATATNTITIGSSQVLTLNGGLTVGYSASAGTATTSKLTTSGTGSLAVNGTSIVVGVDITGAANSAWFNQATLNVASLTSFSTNVTNFNVGSGTLSAPTGAVILSNTANTILATTMTVGNTGGNNGNGASTLTLGTGTNVLQIDTIQIGRGKGSGPGFIQFASQLPGPGTVTINNKLGTGAANIDIGNLNGTATAGGAVGTLDLRGHTSTVTAGTVTMANNNNTSTGGTTATINFDTGTFTVTTLNMAPKSAAGVALATATINLSGGSFTVNSGGSVTLGSQVTAGTSAATLNITGGTFTSNVNILDGGGATTSTITLNGGILDMVNNNIGSATLIDTLNFQSGTLRNVNQINNGGTIVKSTVGTLILTGTNAYTGTTSVAAGVANVQSNTGLGATTGGTTVTAGAALQLQSATSLAIGAEALTLNGGGVATDGALRNISGTNSYDGLITLGSNSRINSDAGSLTLTNAGTITGAGFTLSLGGAANGSIASIIGTTTGGVAKDGAGTWTLSGASTYTGATTVTAGKLTAGVATFAFGNNSAVSMANTLGATLDITGFNTQIGSITGGGATGGNVTLGAATLTTGGDNTSPAAYAGVISGTGGVTKIGTGTQAFSGSSTYTGVTTLTAGVLSVGTIGNGGVSGNLGAATNAAGNLVFDGGTLQYTGATDSTDRNFTINATKVATIDIATGATVLTMSGVSAATSGGLTKIGAGTLLLSGANLHTGLTTVNAGTLLYGASDVIATGGVTVDGATAILNIATFSDTVGTVTLDNGGAINGTSGILTSTGSFELRSGSASAILNGAVALNKTTGGTVTLTGTNTNTGVTTLTAGVLSVGTIGNGGVSGNLGAATNAAGNLVFDGGTLRYTGATDSTDRNFTINTTKVATIDVATGATVLTMSGASAATSGGLTKIGAGTLLLTGANAHSGTTTVTAGTLSLGGSGSFANSTTVAIGAAGTLNTSGVTGGANYSGTQFALAAGQTLSGTGTVSGPITVATNSTMAPGPGTGSLTLTSGVTTQANSTLAFGIFNGSTVAPAITTGGSSLPSASNPSTSNNFLNITGGATTIHSGTLIVINAGSTTFTDGGLYSYTVATGAGDQSATNINTQNQFVFNSTANFSGINYSLTGDNGNLYVNFTAIAVPEPATILGIAAAGLGLAGWVRRRRNAKANG